MYFRQRERRHAYDNDSNSSNSSSDDESKPHSPIASCENRPDSKGSSPKQKKDDERDYR